MTSYLRGISVLLVLSVSLIGCALQSEDETDQDENVGEAAEALTHRSALVHLQNLTGAPFKFQVMHQYTGDPTQASDFIYFNPGEDKYVLTVNYNTGFFTTGRDNWIVNGIELKELDSSVTGSITVDGIEYPVFQIEGHVYVDLKRWKSGHGFGAEWKIHTLRAEDDGKVTTIAVFPSIVEFRSPSGRSSTWFTHEYDIIPHF